MLSVLAALSLAGCGVRGPLEPPAEAKAEGTATSGAAADAGENSAAKPKPHRGFVFDGLLR
jgi:predicted small lipoprotein YifL